MCHVHAFQQSDIPFEAPAPQPTTATPASDASFTAEVEAFSERLLGVLNNAALALMLSIGHRSGLLDTMSSLPASTVDEIAAAAGLHPRYVREWLGAMVAGRVVDYRAEDDTYVLPESHAGALTRAAAPNNIAAFMQYVPLLGSVEDKVLSCFRTGGGVPYAAFPRFQQVMADDSGQTVLPALLEHILPLEPNVASRLERGIDVFEVGCGSGRALNLLAQTFPNSRFTGVDLSEQAIRNARSEADRKGLANIRFEARDAATIDDVERYDLVLAFDAIHDQARPRDVLSNLHRALRPGGYFLMQDIDASSDVEDNVDHPIGTFLYTVSCLHCMTVSLAEGGEGLGAMWGRQQALELLGEAGFVATEVHELPHDIQNCYYIARP